MKKSASHFGPIAEEKTINIDDILIAYWDTSLTCRYANQSFEKWFGKSSSDMINKVQLGEMIGDALGKNEAYIKAVLSGEPQFFERTFNTTIGKELQVAVHYYPDISKGKVQGFVSHVVDVNLFKSVEYKIENAELKLLQVIDNLSDAIVVFDSATTIKAANKAACALFGYTKDELIGKERSFILPDTTIAAEKGRKKTRNITSGKLESPLEKIEYGLSKSGQKFEVELVSSPIVLGSQFLISTTVRDITEKRRLERAQTELAQLNRIIVEQSAFAHAMVDNEMRYVSVSKRWCQDYGLDSGDIIGKSHYEIFPEITDEWKAIHKRCLSGEVISRDEDLFVRADGSIQWLRWDVRPWYHANAAIGGMLMFSEDITQSKQREQQNTKIQYILKKSAQIAKIATWEMDHARQFVTCDDMAYEILELDKSTVLTFETPFELCKDDEQRKNLREAADRINEKNTTYDVQIEIITGKGNSKWIRIIGEADFANGVNTRRYGIFQDITSMKDAELNLSQLNQDLNAVLNSGQVSIISTDLRGHVRYLNYGAEKMLGYSNSGFILQKDILLLHDPTELENRRIEYEHKFNCGLSDFGVITIHAVKGEYEASEWLYKTGAGQIIPVQLTVTPVRNSLGKITGYLFVAVDISKMKEVKSKLRSLLEITLQQNKRLKNFAHIVSHNLRSHSANIEMLIDLLLQEQPNLQADQSALYLQKASRNLKETITHLNEVVAINANENNSLVPVKLRSAIEQNLQSLIQDIQEADLLVINKVPESIEVHGLPAYVDSITLNLLTNAIKYRNRKVKSFVKFEAIEQGEFILLTVEDNGLGIDLNLHGRKIFRMYKTFHGNKDSRGIGLFITKNQIEAMGGTIEVSSEVNKGTVFTIRLRNEKY